MVCDSRVCPMSQAKQTEHRATSDHAPRVSHRHIVSRPARIGATHEASSGALLCYSPPAQLVHVSLSSDVANASHVIVRVALFDPPEQQWSPLATALSFGFYTDATIGAISPRTGPVGGGTRLSITGGLFARVVSGSTLPISPASPLPNVGARELQRCGRVPVRGKLLSQHGLWQALHGQVHC